jgi:IS30 family transposase
MAKKSTGKALLSDSSDDKRFSETWNKVCCSKDLDQIDRAIMQQVVRNPLCSLADIAKAINFSRQGVLRRMRRQDFVDAQTIFEGSFQQRMQRIALKVAKRMESMAENDLIGFLERVKEIQGMEPSAQAVAYRYLEKEYDPQKIIDIAKMALGYLGKAAELEVAKEAINKNALPSVEQAMEILKKDLADD